MGICFTPPTQATGIFGFTEFVQALAIFVIVYTITDQKYKFRISVVPFNLARITFYITLLIGLCTLASDWWFKQNKLTPFFISNQSHWQICSGAAFLMCILSWLWFSYLSPPKFGRFNSKKYTTAIYKRILHGEEDELLTIASEIVDSAPDIVRFAPHPGVYMSFRKECVELHAYELLMMIGNRRFCRVVANAHPSTAIRLFEQAIEQEKLTLPLGQFAANVTTEAILNKDSLIYHEDSGYDSGYTGLIKLFTNTLYGNYRFIEQISNNNKSAFDINYQTMWQFDADQLRMFCDLLLVTIKSYVDDGYWGVHSFVIYTAFSEIKKGGRSLYKYNGNQDALFDSVDYNKFSAVVGFIENVVIFLNEKQQTFPTVMRIRQRRARNGDLYDIIAEAIFDLIYEAASIKSPSWACWMLHHNTIWTKFFHRNDGIASKVIRFKVTRLIYDEIIGSQTNFLTAAYIGFCLNVMGLKLGNRRDFHQREFPLHVVLLTWVKRNYLRLRAEFPEVANACLIGNVSFDQNTNQLAYSNSGGLNKTTTFTYLTLDPYVAPNKSQPENPAPPTRTTVGLNSKKRGHLGRKVRSPSRPSKR